MPTDESPESLQSEQPEGAPRYSFTRLMVLKACFEQIERAPRTEGEKKPAVLRSKMDLRLGIKIDEPNSQGQITLSVNVHPDLRWQPYKIEVVVSGVFSAENASTPIFNEFCRMAVPSILFPYVRQIIYSLTRGREVWRCPYRSNQYPRTDRD